MMNIKQEEINQSEKSIAQLHIEKNSLRMQIEMLEQRKDTCQLTDEQQEAALERKL